MIIRKKEFQWARPLKPLDLSNVTAIALHHMEHLTAGMDEIHSWHLDRGWKGFAYNYWIDFDGVVWECRGLNAGGGLFDPLNNAVLSVGFKGDYDKTKKMPEAQFKAGYELIHYLRELVPTIELVAGHKHWQNKSCPGKYFPLEEMIKMADKKPKNKDFDDVAPWAKDAVQNVVESGIMVGNDQGLFKPRDMITRQEVAVIVSRLLQKIELLQKTNS